MKDKQMAPGVQEVEYGMTNYGVLAMVVQVNC